MSELMQEYFKRIQPQAPADPIKLGQGDVLYDPSTKQQLFQAPYKPDGEFRILNDQQEADRGLDPTKRWQVGPDGRAYELGSGGQTINVNNAPAGAPDNLKLREGFSGKIVDYTMAGIEAGDVATSNNMKLGQLKSYLDTAPQGFEGQWKALAGNFGIPSEGLDDIQAAEALISQLVPGQRAPGSGTMSDADLALYKASLPAISKQAGGNQKIIETAMAINTYYEKHAAIDRQLALGNITVEKAWEQKQAIPNPLAGYTIPVDQSAFPGVTIEENK
jgi:hypothetical protein